MLRSRAVSGAGGIATDYTRGTKSEFEKLTFDGPNAWAIPRAFAAKD